MTDNLTKFAVRKASLQLNEENSEEIYEYATIVIVEPNGLTIPHPLTSFVKTMYGKKDNNYNSQKAAAAKIVYFLNWLLIENREIYKITSLSQLRVSHGVDFLNYLKTTKITSKNSSKLRSRNTLEKYEYYLSKFFRFLNKKKIINSQLFDGIDVNSQSLFIGNGFSLPSKSIARTEKQLEHFPHIKLINYFFEAAETIHPEIILGIYIQFFGGLRRGEIVNLLRKDIKVRGPFGSQGCVVKISYKPFLWERLSDPSKCQVKRDVTIFPIQPIEIIPFLFKNSLKKHMDFLEKNQSINKFNSLFIDKDGNALSGSDYEKKFNKIKEVFLKRIETECPEYYHLLSTTPWGTHIGRRIYTNLMAKVVKSPSELAIRRGDKNLETALIYLSKEGIRTDIENGLSLLYEEHIKNEIPFEEDRTLYPEYKHEFEILWK